MRHSAKTMPLHAKFRKRASLAEGLAVLHFKHRSYGKYSFNAFHRLRTDRNIPLLVAFPYYPHPSVAQVQIVNFERREFTDSQSEEYSNSKIAESLLPVSELRKKRSISSAVRALGSGLLGLRCSDGCSRIHQQNPLPNQEPEETPEGRELSPDRDFL